MRSTPSCTATPACAAALFTREPPKGVIFHSDRGCQYTSGEFADFCAVNGVVRSMGRRAACYDNAVAESFFATYKKELTHTRPWNDLTEVRQTHSCGSRATTIAASGTPPSAT